MPGAWRRRNVTILAEAVRQGYHVVATEPAAALCLVHEYPQLLDDDDARLLAANASEACTFLWKMHIMGTLQLDLRPINAVLGYHAPCHLKALGVGLPGVNLLGLIPGLRVHTSSRAAPAWPAPSDSAQELPQQPAGGLGPDLAAARSGPPGRQHRVQRLQNPDGAGHHETHAPPHQTPGAFLRPHARTRPPDHPRRRTARYV